MAADATAGDAPPHVVEDCRGALLVLSDGTVVRSTPPIAAAPDGVRVDPSVEWKDAVYDAAHGLGLRIYKPAAAGTPKLRVVVYFHGGGFCIGSYAWPIFHAACTPPRSPPSSSPPTTASPRSTVSPPPSTTPPPPSSGSATAPPPTPGSPSTPTKPRPL
ncbi:unnamed protein product [Urochloa humidicola]